MTKKLVIVCLSNFLIASLMGLLLRLAYIYPLAINHRFLTHAHSHVAMLGWAYLMLYVLLIHYFAPKDRSIYRRLFWVTQIAVWGMMLSFPFQGYAAVSITFSTLHILCSYYFVFLAWKHFRFENKISAILIKTSLFFMVLSTLGVWCLGPAVGLYGNTSDLYQIAIQFFLHFQFNGWFLFAVIGLFFHILNIQDSNQFRAFHRLLLLATIFTLALPLQWYLPHKLLYWINASGVIMQLLALVFFLKIIKPTFNPILAKASKLEIYLYSFSICCFIMKILSQWISLAPEFSQVIYQHRLFVIGFIHLIMLGTVTGFLFAFVIKNKLVTPSASLSLGVYSFISGFFLTELLLVFQGYLYFTEQPTIPNYNLMLFLFSILLPLGITLFFVNLINHKKSAE